MLQVLADQPSRADHFLGRSGSNLNAQRVISGVDGAEIAVAATKETGDIAGTTSMAKTDRAKIQRVTKPKSEILIRPENEDMSDSNDG
jgi:hypothetical protein